MIILLIVVAVFAFGKGFNLFAISGGFTPVFCNDYEFTCCNEKVDLANQLYTINSQQFITCPDYATKCVINSFSVTGFTSNGIRQGSSNCRLYSPLIGKDRYLCDDGSDLSIGSTVSPTKKIYVNNLGSYLETASIYMTVYKSQLDFCGRAGCTQGVQVSGADGCKFNPPLGIIYTTTSSLTGKVQTNSYTTPLSSCILSFNSGDRHICGYKEETCSADTDCTGHTYGTKECLGRTLQTYGCRSFGTTITGGDRTPSDNGWGSDALQTTANTFGKRCEIISATNVQCCGDTDCGLSYVCDTKSFTCKPAEQVQCSNNYDCGVSTQCDYVGLKLKTPRCSAGKCGYSEQAVDCCNDNNCPVNNFCNEDHECEAKTAGIDLCPFECCLNEPKYTQRNCPSGEFCINNECKAEGCSSDADCNTGYTCQNGNCVKFDGSCKWYQESYTSNSCGFWCKLGLQETTTSQGCRLNIWIFVIGGIVVLMLGGFALTGKKGRRRR